MASAIPNGRVIGVDISPSMIEFAKGMFSNYSNLKFFIQDAAHIDFQEKFDLITSFTVMQWVLEQQQAFEGFEKALKPGGKLCIQMPTGLPVAMDEALTQMLKSKKWKEYFTHFAPPWKFYQPEEYGNLACECPFDCKFGLIQQQNMKSFLLELFLRDFYDNGFPILRPLPSDLKDVFLTELVDRYLQTLPVDQQGQVSFIVTRLEVEASK